MEIFDVIIIGAGQAGNPLSTTFAQAGKKTALIEQNHLGGSCINTGCTPTKTMIASAEIAHLVRQSEIFGVKSGEVSVDLKKVRQRKNDIVTSFREGIQNRIGNSDVDLIYGKATFSGPKTVFVKENEGGERQLTAEIIIIDTGSHPRLLELDGLSQINYLDSTQIMELEEIPQHLVILGGSYIALEFGQMFHHFGSRVTILELGDQLMPREDKDIADSVADIFNEEGIQILLNAKANSTKPINNGGFSLNYSMGNKDFSIEGSHLLLAIGRVPNSADLNLEAAGIKTGEHGFITVNEFLETNVPGVYAVGDVNGGPAFTHNSYDDYRILKANILEGKNKSTKGRLVPYVLYTDPQLGRIGLSEKEAREKGLNIQVVKLPMKQVARAIEVNRTYGMLKVVVDMNSKLILGAACLGFEGGEIMAMLEIAMLGNLTYPVLRNAIFAHPSLAEALNNLFADLP
ncbi:MAG: mercuric reductase [Anaerolineaceae bacterium]|nr:mercuric reductase [Anaerolineaceae bacterium]